MVLFKFLLCVLSPVISFSVTVLYCSWGPLETYNRKKVSSLHLHIGIFLILFIYKKCFFIQFFWSVTIKLQAELLIVNWTKIILAIAVSIPSTTLNFRSERPNLFLVWVLTFGRKFSFACKSCLTAIEIIFSQSKLKYRWSENLDLLWETQL